ncbi:trypsin-like peptidase domain-containing protein [Streptomyces sp. NBC_00846]|uniref:trypsin-like serine peptidase n=1 Tax=Streptomyces sp. NBC_00846 TaxID=2975849 RepID=UPI003866DBF9|nr:trypsin-like peptidase domain-containing protein [Streptomyces sp. NBC_00846]
MGNRRAWASAVAAVLITLGTVGCSHRGGGVSTAGPEIVVHDAAITKQDRSRVETYWTGTGIADVARGDAIGDPVQPEWTEGGVIARTVGRLYAQGTGGGLGACTATVVGTNTVITAAHCVRTSDAGEPSRSATWDQQLYFVPGYHDGKSPYGGFTVRRVRMAEEWQDEGLDVAVLEMNSGDDGRSISEVTGVQRISFTADSGTRTHFFGYPYTNRLLHCEGGNSREYRGSALLRIPCVMGVGSSGGPYIVDLDAAEAGSVVAVNISGDETFSYGTALGSFARRLYAKSEHCSRDC